LVRLIELRRRLGQLAVAERSLELAGVKTAQVAGGVAEVLELGREQLAIPRALFVRAVIGQALCAGRALAQVLGDVDRHAL